MKKLHIRIFRTGVKQPLTMIAILCFVFMLSFVILGANVFTPTIAKANTTSIVNPGETDATSSEDVGYYMFLDLKGVKTSLICNPAPTGSINPLLPMPFWYTTGVTANKKFMNEVWGEFKAFSRQDKNATVIFRFPHILYKDVNAAESKGNPLLVQCVLSLNFPGSRTLGNDIIFNGTTFENGRIRVNLRKSYYDYFKKEVQAGNDLACYSSLYWRGSAYALHSTTMHTANNCATTCMFSPDKITLETGVVSDDDIGDNGGSDGAGLPTKKNGFNLLFWFFSIWGSTQPLDIFWQVLFCVVGLIIFALLFKFFRWLRGN